MLTFKDYGGLSPDEMFQTICVRRYNELPLGLLVFWIGHLWTDLFGFSLLNLRYLTSIEYLLTMGVTTAYLYENTRNLRLSGLVFLLGCVLLRIGAFYIYNWDSGSYLFDGIALCLVLSLISRPNLKKAFFLGLAIGLMTLGRTPSGIFLPIACIIAWLSTKEHDNKKMRNRIPLMILTGWFITMVLFTTIILGSPWEYILLFAEGNVISGHSPINDFNRLWSRFYFMLDILPYIWFFGLSTILIALLLAKLNNKKIIFRCILCIWMIFCILNSYWMSKRASNNLIDGMDTPLGLGLLLALPIYNLFTRKIKHNRFIRFKLWVCFLTVLSFAFGSDAFQERWIFAFTIPVIIAILWKVPSKSLKKFLKYFVFISTLSFSSMWIIHVISIKLSFREFVKSEIPLLEGLNLEKNKIKNLEGIYNMINDLRKQGIPYVFAGDHLLSEMLAGADEGVSFHQFHANISECEDWDNYRDTAINKVDAVIVSPGDMSRFNKTLFNDLKKEGFSESARYENLILFKRDVRKNPDKQYEIIE